MYTPVGTTLSEVGDVEAFAAGDELHLFHLTLPNHDVVQHAVSDDGLAWRALPAAIRTGDPGECDDDQIWTMSVTQRGDADFVMVYTALARADAGRVQRTAVATSRDLIHWTKSDRNPVASADPRWYEADPADSGRVSWRDPKPVRVGDVYFATVSAREKSGPLLRRGCVGLLASADLETWEVRPPLFAPRGHWDLECPQVFEIGGVYYLTAAVMEDRTQRYWQAPRFEGPYEVPSDGGRLAPRGHYAGRVVRWQGQALFLCWHEPVQTTKSAGAILPKANPVHPDVDWAEVRNPFGKYVVAPLLLEPDTDGRLVRRSFPGWTAYRDAPLASVMPAETTALQAEPSHGVWSVNESGGTDILTMTEAAEHFWLEGDLTLSAGAGGLVFRFANDGGGYFVRLQAGSASVSLVKWLGVAEPDRSWFRYAEIQRGEMARPLIPGEPIRFHLLVVGPYLECSLNGEIVFATVSAERVGGPVGIWAESGRINARNVFWAPMHVPQHS